MTKVHGAGYGNVPGPGTDLPDNARRRVGRVAIDGAINAALQTGKQTFLALTCATAGIDAAAPAAAPSFAKYLFAWCTNSFRLAFGEATSSTIGCFVAANDPRFFPLAAGGDNKVHAQSDTTLSIVNLSYLADLP